jgi:hypothetical protein
MASALVLCNQSHVPSPKCRRYNVVTQCRGAVLIIHGAQKIQAEAPRLRQWLSVPRKSCDWTLDPAPPLPGDDSCRGLRAAYSSKYCMQGTVNADRLGAMAQAPAMRSRPFVNVIPLFLSYSPFLVYPCVTRSARGVGRRRTSSVRLEAGRVCGSVSPLPRPSLHSRYSPPNSLLVYRYILRPIRERGGGLRASK